MSDVGDYDGEMRAFRPGLDDEAIEQLLAGTPPEELADLADVIEAMRMQATRTPPRPSPELAAVLSEGLTTDKGTLPTTAARNAATPAMQGPRLPKWTRRTRMILETALAKLAALGLTAKVGVAGAAVAAATTGAGAAGVLPDSLQDAMADAVAAVTPFQLPSSADDAGADEDVVGDTDENAEFGERVADDATGQTDDEPGVDGSEIADEASNGRSNDLPDDAEEGRSTGEQNRDEAEANADEAADNADEGLTEAENNAPDEADAHIPDEAPAEPDQGDDAADSTAPESTPDGAEEGQEADDAPAPANTTDEDDAGRDTAESSTPQDTPDEDDAGPDAGSDRG